MDTPNLTPITPEQAAAFKKELLRTFRKRLIIGVGVFGGLVLATVLLSRDDEDTDTIE